MNDPGFTETVNKLLDILGDLDEDGRPKVKLPACPKCDEDELAVIHANLLLCYRCGWKIEAVTTATVPAFDRAAALAASERFLAEPIPKDNPSRPTNSGE